MFKDLMAPYVSPLAPVPTSVEPKNSLKNPIRAVIFDIYGTLFISASGDISTVAAQHQNLSAIDALFAKYKISFHSKQLKELVVQAIGSEHTISRKKGIDFPEIRIEQIFKKILQNIDIETVQQFCVEYEMIINPVYPMPNLKTMIEQMNKQNILMGIISNAQFFTPHLFDLFCNDFPEKLGFDPDMIFYSYEFGYAKPSLFMFKKAAAQLSSIGLIPENVLYVGNDMLNDIYTAHTIGFQTCLFAGDRRSLRLRKNKIECKLLKPDAVIKDLNQLTDMIRSC